MKMNIADYIVLNATPIRLSSHPETGHPREKRCRFQLVNDFFAGNPNTAPVLVFRTQVLKDHDTRVNVYVNPEPIEKSSDGFPPEDFMAQLPKEHYGLHMQALQGTKFLPGQENVVVVRISGDGTKFGDVIIGDIVLHIQRTISL